VLHEVVPQAPLQLASFSYRKPSTTMVLHAMTCTFYLINEFVSRLDLNSFESIATVKFYIFLDRT
jgi:hypothetical protein